MQSWFYIYDDSDSVCLTSRTSARCLLQIKKTYFVLSKMTLRRKHVAAAVVLMIVIKVFSVQTLTCHRTEYQIGNECCPMCPAGSRVKTDCTEFTSTSCYPCEYQTFLDKPNGLRQCQRCTNCDSGSGLTVKWPCTQISDTVCEVMEGFFCIDSEGGGCRAAQRHKRCEPGQYVRGKGTSSSDTECSDCSRGTFSDGTFSSCQTHTQCETKNLQLIKEGTTSTDAECGEKPFRTPVGAIVGSIVFFFSSCCCSGTCSHLQKEYIKIHTRTTWKCWRDLARSKEKYETKQRKPRWKRECRRAGFKRSFQKFNNKSILLLHLNIKPSLISQYRLYKQTEVFNLQHKRAVKFLLTERPAG